MQHSFVALDSIHSWQNQLALDPEQVKEKLELSSLNPRDPRLEWIRRVGQRVAQDKQLLVGRCLLVCINTGYYACRMGTETAYYSKGDMTYLEMLMGQQQSKLPLHAHLRLSFMVLMLPPLLLPVPMPLQLVDLHLDL